ncbi:hypothetical protein ES704_01086 [subsurface metagenome]|jgi:galactokinase
MGAGTFINSSFSAPGRINLIGEHKIYVSNLTAGAKMIKEGNKNG